MSDVEAVETALPQASPSMQVMEREVKKDERPIAEDTATRPPTKDEEAMKSELFQAAPPNANVEISEDKSEAKPPMKYLPDSVYFDDFMEFALTRLPPSRIDSIGDAFDAAVPHGGVDALSKTEALTLAMKLWERWR